MHFLNACILKTDEKNALRFKNADFKNQMSDANVSTLVALLIKQLYWVVETDLWFQKRS